MNLRVWIQCGSNPQETRGQQKNPYLANERSEPSYASANAGTCLQHLMQPTRRITGV
jgi:hypothetical protein